MKSSANNHISRIIPKTLFYGWVIVAACTLIMVMQYGIQYSFGVFFKPLADDFGWSRAATSGAYALLMVCAGATAIPIGWLADKFGPARVMAVCSFIMGLAIVLASQVNQLWQLYAAFGVMLGIGIGGTMAITGGVTTRWFVKKRGLALGIVSAGIGLGTFIFPPVAERLIAAFDWSNAFIIIGIVSCVVTVGASLLLRRSPTEMGLQPYGADEALKEQGKTKSSLTRSMGLKEAIRTQPLWLLMAVFFFVNICVQVVLVHLINYATDLGIDPLAAATLVSVIGIGSIIGRLAMGAVSDRIGGNNTLIITCILLLVSMVWLVFAHQMWMLYIFAVFFGFAYGGEVPQIPLLIGQFFGLQAVMALTGVNSAATRAGGALGSWFAGAIFDSTHSYFIAFTITAVAAFIALIAILLLKRAAMKRKSL